MKRDWLKGVTIVSTALNLPGPLACQRLYDLGAEVHKCEPPEGDPLHHAYPKWYAKIHEGIKISKINLKQNSERRSFDEALAKADILITATRPSSLKTLSLSWDTLHARFPKLNMIMILGYQPPRDEEPAHDLNCQAEAGLIRPPQMPTALISDFVCAERVVSESLALVVNRRATNEGALSQVTMMESAQWVAQSLTEGATRNHGLLGGGSAGYGLYETQQGWIALGAIEGKFQEYLKKNLNLNKLDTSELKNLFKTKTASQWESWAKPLDIPLVAVK